MGEAYVGTAGVWTSSSVPVFVAGRVIIRNEKGHGLARSGISGLDARSIYASLLMARTKQTACKATEARITVLPDVTHTPPVVEDGLLHTRCREKCPLSQLLCRALREMGRRAYPFISVQTVHEEGDCMAQVVLPRGTFTGQETITTYGANEEEAYRKAVMAALPSLSSGWEPGHTVLHYLPTNDLDHTWLDRREQLQDRNGSRALVACMDCACEARGMYHRAEDQSRFYFDRYTETPTHVEELEAQVAQLQ
ncbi:hypothetical protein U9M48_028348 [Paspalum notatum var. saurae]|uniref:Uncharacterized protein n=1 Tax=Paspalum notatum var. saurae TaxID=547442 RepID=A0AAQ3U142_PASNO